MSVEIVALQGLNDTIANVEIEFNEKLAVFPPKIAACEETFRKELKDRLETERSVVDERFKQAEEDAAKDRQLIDEAQKQVENLKRDAEKVKEDGDAALNERLQELRIDIVDVSDRVDKNNTSSSDMFKELQQRIMRLQEIEDTRGQPEFEIKKILQRLAEYFAKIEGTVSNKADVPDIDGGLAKYMTRSAQEIAESFAKQADCTAMVEQLIRNMKNPDKMSFDEDGFEQKIDILRYQLTSGFLVNLVRSTHVIVLLICCSLHNRKAQEVHLYNVEPNDSQMTTRSKLLNKMRKTIEIALTKYEQVSRKKKTLVPNFDAQVEIVADSCLQVGDRSLALPIQLRYC